MTQVLKPHLPELMLILVAYGAVVSPHHVDVVRTTRQKHDIARSALERIPDGVSVWAPARFTGHLAFRKKIKSVPPNATYPEFFVNDGFPPDFILLEKSSIDSMGSPYQEALDRVLKEQSYEVVFDEGQLTVLRRLFTP